MDPPCADGSPHRTLQEQRVATSYETICKYLDTRGIDYSRHDNGAILIRYETNKYRDPQGQTNLLIAIELEQEGRFVKIFVPNAFSYRDGPYKAVVLQAALFINFQTKMLQFEYDPRDGEIRAMVEFPLEDSPLGEEQFFRAFTALCLLLEESSPFMHQAMSGTLDAETCGLDKDTFAQFMRLMRTEAGNDSQFCEDHDMLEHKATKARSMYERFMRRHEFRPGQLVRWKPELKNRTFPAYGECGVVVRVLPEPVTDGGNDSGTRYFREPLDIVLGFVDEDGDFITYYYDSRRFAPIIEQTGNDASS
jgi:hypothetical protein